MFPCCLVPGFERRPVGQQQPIALLQDAVFGYELLVCLLVVGGLRLLELLIGPVLPTPSQRCEHPVVVVLYDVESIIDDPHPWTQAAEGLAVLGVHVHGDGLHIPHERFSCHGNEMCRLPLRVPLLEEQDLSAFKVDGHGRIDVVPVQGELVYPYEAVNTLGPHLSVRMLKTGLVHLPDKIPVCSKRLRHICCCNPASGCHMDDTVVEESGAPEALLIEWNALSVKSAAHQVPVDLVFDAQHDQCTCDAEMPESQCPGQMAMRPASAFWAVAMLLARHPHMMDFGHRSLSIVDDVDLLSSQLALWQMKDTSAIIHLGASPDVGW